MNEDLPKLLRAIAGGTEAQANRHDVILNAAALEIERLRADAAAMRAVVTRIRKEIQTRRLATD